MHWASALGHVSVAELLIRAGADVNVIDEMHATPLHLAAVGPCAHLGVAEGAVEVWLR